MQYLNNLIGNQFLLLIALGTSDIVLSINKYCFLLNRFSIIWKKVKSYQILVKVNLKIFFFAIY